MEIRINLAEVSRALSLMPGELDEITQNLTVDIKKELDAGLQHHASRLGDYPGGGNLAKRGMIVTATSRRVTAKPAPGFIRQVSLLEFGPNANYPKTFYLSNKQPKLKKWASHRLNKTAGKITIGGKGTKFGKPSHQFITNAKYSTLSRLDRIVMKNIKNIGGK